MGIRIGLMAIGAAALAGFASACGSGDDARRSTSTARARSGRSWRQAADRYEARAASTSTSTSRASGRGIERFCDGEIDIANTSRTIDEDEAAACAENGIDYVALQVASDALTVAINRPILYDWVTCLTVEQLTEDLGAGLDGRQLAGGRPVVPGPAAEAVRQPGLRHLQVLHARHQRRARGEPHRLPRDGRPPRDGRGRRRRARRARATSASPSTSRIASASPRSRSTAATGCVEPSAETVHDGSYRPLARSLYIYVNQASLDGSRPLRSFVRYILENARPIADEALFVPLLECQRQAQMQKFVDAISS